MKQISLVSKLYCVITGVAVAALLLLAGCGSDNSSGGSTGAGDEVAGEAGSLTKAQFIRRADAICKEGSEEFQSELAVFLRRNSDAGSSQPELGAAAEELVETIYIPNQESQMEQIGSLGAPSGDEKEIEAIFDAMQRALVVVESHPLKFVRGVAPTYTSLGKVERLAKAYGLTECGRG